MCVASIAWQAHPDWLLVAVGNRDELHERASAPLARWDDASGIIAGRDLQGGGTWLGASTSGRFALVTNYRVPEGPQPGRPSRGVLVTDILQGKTPERTAEMNPFNLVAVDRDRAWIFSNYPEEIAFTLSPGIHGLSNGGFEDPWPKTQQLNAALGTWLFSEPADVDGLFAALRAETPTAASPPDVRDPEPDFAPVFIRNPLYGTRCSTVVAIDRNGAGTIVERRFSPEGAPTGETAIEFAWPA